MDIDGMEIAGTKIQYGNNATPMEEILDLSGRVAIVTAGARGLGFVSSIGCVKLELAP